jgi:uncharacterized membrane protein
MNQKNNQENIIEDFLSFLTSNPNKMLELENLGKKYPKKEDYQKFIENLVAFANKNGFDFSKEEYTKNLNNAVSNTFNATNKKIENYKCLGLMIFVAIPLPGTGAWTGALIAAVLGMNFKESLFYISAGNFIAASIVAAISYGLLGLFF